MDPDVVVIGAGFAGLYGLHKLRGLGFSRVGQRIVREDTPSIRGMVRKVRHLVSIEKG